MKHKRNRGGAGGGNPPTPARLDNGEEDADLILQTRTRIALELAARARESMEVFSKYASPEDLVDEVEQRDQRWFEAHPDEEVRVRRAVEGEFLGMEALLPPFEWVEVRRTGCRPIFPGSGLPTQRS